MAKKKSSIEPIKATVEEIELTRKWLAVWLNECVRRASQPKQKASFVGTFGPNGESPDEFMIGPPDRMQSLLDRQHAMPRHVLDTFLFENFAERGGIVMRECVERGWVSHSTLYAPGEKHEIYHIEDAAAVEPKTYPPSSAERVPLTPSQKKKLRRERVQAICKERNLFGQWAKLCDKAKADATIQALGLPELRREAVQKMCEPSSKRGKPRGNSPAKIPRQR